MHVVGSIKQISAVPGVQAKGPPLTPLDTQLPAGEISKTNSITMTLIAFVSVFFGFVVIIYSAAVPRDGHMLRGKVQEKLPELWAHPSVPGQVGSVRPATDNTKGLAPTFPCLHPVMIDRNGRPG